MSGENIGIQEDQDPTNQIALERVAGEDQQVVTLGGTEASGGLRVAARATTPEETDPGVVVRQAGSPPLPTGAATQATIELVLTAIVDGFVDVVTALGETLSVDVTDRAGRALGEVSAPTLAQETTQGSVLTKVTEIAASVAGTLLADVTDRAGRLLGVVNQGDPGATPWPTTDTATQALITTLIGSSPDHQRDTGNEQTVPLIASDTFEGAYRDVSKHAHFEILYASQTPLTSVQKIWSNDGVTPLGGLFGTSSLTAVQLNGYYVYYDLNEGRNIAPFYKLKVVNGATPQTAFPGFISITWLIKTPYQGSFGTLTATLNNLSRALLTRTALAALLPSGVFANLTATDTRSLRVGIEDSPANAAGEIRVTGIQDTISHIFSASKADDEIARLQDASTGGTATKNVTDGQVVFATGTTPGNTAIFFSEKHAVYQAGHPIDGDQTFVLESLPTGAAKVEFGFSDMARQNGIGYGVDATGTYVWRQKNGTYESKVYQSAWNRDKCTALENSRYLFNNAPQTHNPLRSNLYFERFEWFGAAPPEYRLKAPNGSLITTHLEEYPNQNVGSSLPDPDLHLFVSVYNDSTASPTAPDLRVRSGCWRGGSNTSRNEVVGLNPDNDYENIRAQGSHAGNSTAIPLGGNEVYRGTWFPWQKHYVKMLSDLQADVACTLYIDLSQELNPTDGDDSDITDSLGPFPYDPVATPLLRRHTAVQSVWVRHRLVNGPAAMSELVLDAGFVMSDPGAGTQPFAVLPQARNLGAMTRTIPAVPVDNAEPPTAYREWPVATGGVPQVSAVAIESDVTIGALRLFENGQLSVGPTRVQIPPPLIANVKGISITNLDADTDVFWGGDMIAADSLSDVILARGGKDIELDGVEAIYLIASDTGAIISQGNRFPTTTANNVGVSSPSNMLAIDNVYATFDVSTDSVELTGFTAAAVQPDILTVILKLEGKKGTNATVETVAHEETQTGSTTGAGTVATASIAGGTAKLYLATVSRNATSGTVTQVMGLGLTWIPILVNVQDTNRRIDVWYAYGDAPSGIVTASLSTSTNAHIAVTRVSNADPSSPIQASGSTTGTGTSVTGPVIAGTSGGKALLAVSHTSSGTAGAGYTERSDEANGTGSNTDGLSTETKPLVSTGNETGTYTLASSASWVAIGVTIRPRPAIDPVMTVTYEVDGIPGTLSLTATLTATSDMTFELDLSGDQTWTAAKIADTTLTIASTTIGAANASIDAVYLDVTEIEADVTARVTYSWLAEPPS